MNTIASVLGWTQCTMRNGGNEIKRSGSPAKAKGHHLTLTQPDSPSMKKTVTDQIPAEFHRIEKSRLVSSTQLRDTINRLALVNEIVTVEALLKELWKEGVLSKWQALQLNAGRFKGFFLSHYIVLKLSILYTDSFLAEVLDTETGRFVLLKVSKFEKPNVVPKCFLGLNPNEGLQLLSTDARLERQ